MENKSLIPGTIWYWRKTFMNVPMHGEGRFSGATEVKELCLVVDHSEKTKELAEELTNAQIHVLQKEVHLASKNIPEGSSILYIRQPNRDIEDDEDDFEEAEQNLQKLKEYIFQHGGKIDGEAAPQPIRKSIFSFFRRRGRG